MHILLIKLKKKYPGPKCLWPVFVIDLYRGYQDKTIYQFRSSPSCQKQFWIWYCRTNCKLLYSDQCFLSEKRPPPPYSLYNYLSRSCLILVCFLIFGYYYIHVGGTGTMVVHCHNFETLVFLTCVFPYKEKTSGNTNEDLQVGITFR